MDPALKAAIDKATRPADTPATHHAELAKDRAHAYAGDGDGARRNSLRMAAEASGGRVLQAELSGLTSTFKKVLDEVRARDVLAFTLEGVRRGRPGSPALHTVYVFTYYVCMNVTLSIDERLVERARRVAGAMGKSLNQLVREYLEALTTRGGPEDFASELRELSARAGGRSRGRKFTREDAHERP